MAFTIRIGTATVTAETAKEVAELLAELGIKPKEAEPTEPQRLPLPPGFVLQSEGILGGPEGLLGQREYAWNVEQFQKFISRLGLPQKRALAVLVTNGVISDEDLRSALEVPNNQALAGVLSGISKQSMGMMIQPRSIFRYENSRSGGKRRSDYHIAEGLRKIATQLNWPPPDLLPRRAK